MISLAGKTAIVTGAARGIGAACTDRFGGCDILLNNAGIIVSGSILDATVEDFDRVPAVNLRVSFLLGRLVAGQMVEHGTKGSIVNMSSTNAVAQMTKAMAMALAPHDIRVNAIGPGTILTDMLEVVIADDEARRTILSRTPMGRIGDPAEVASVAVFLASDYASYITGDTIYPDGGRLSLNYTVPLREDGAGVPEGH